MKELNENTALIKLASYCSKAERCEFDIRRKLEQWQFYDSIAASNIIKKLVKENYLNEERFCKAYIKDKILYNKWGTNKIIFELKRKHISEELIIYCLKDFSETLYEEQLIKALRAKIRTIKYKDIYDLKAKLVRFALSKGYSYNLSKKCSTMILNDHPL